MTCLIADIGGTNSRCAIVDADGSLSDIKTFANRNFENAPELLASYAAGETHIKKPTHAALAIAAPIRGEKIEMINIAWNFCVSDLQEALSIQHVLLFNDFEGLALGLPEFEAEQLVKIGAGEAVAGQTKAVIGPGTGLGVATLLNAKGVWHAISGEGGHVTLATATDQEAEVVREVRERFGHCSAERLISGPGLSLLHSVLHKEEPIDAAEISGKAIAGDEQALQSFSMMFELLGGVAANLALTVGAFGGIYIGGGIVPRHLDIFSKSGFRVRFEKKGRYSDYLRSIPTYVIVEDFPTLVGLKKVAVDLLRSE